MAITKIKPLKSTIGKAIDYICNPDKTDEGILIDSFCCSPKTAAMEFALTAEQGCRSKDKGNLAYHMVQSFKPGEVSVEEAHKIGMEYARAVLGENYEYVISTHIDRGHIHNHIIFNGVSYATHGKYNDCNRSRRFRERCNDKICKAHNLSIIEKKSGVRGCGKYEYEQAQRGLSWKAKLQQAIDDNIKISDSYEEFLNHMRAAGYEIKEGEHLAFRAEGQQRFTRSKRIGEKYTEENIKKRILDKELYRDDEFEFMDEKQPQFHEYKMKKERSGKIYILIDIKNNLKAQQSTAYKNKLILENINRMVETITYLEKNNFETNYDLLNGWSETKENYEDMQSEIQGMEDEMHSLAEQIKFGKNYWNYKRVYEQSKKEIVDSPFWTEDNTNKVLLFENAKKYMQRNGLTEKDFAIKKLIAKYNSLRQERNELYKKFRKEKELLKEMDVVKDNIESILGREIDDGDIGKKGRKQKKSQRKNTQKKNTER